MFVECHVAQALWDQVNRYLKDTYDVMIEITCKNILLNDVGPNEYGFLNLVVIIVKQKIFAAKCLQQKVRVQQITEEIEFIHELDRKIAYRTGVCKKYNLKWPNKIMEVRYEEQYIEQL